MTKQHQMLYLSPEAITALNALAKRLDTRNQRGEHTISAFCEWLGQTATYSFDETVELLNDAAWIAAGGERDGE